MAVKKRTSRKHHHSSNTGVCSDNHSQTAVTDNKSKRGHRNHRELFDTNNVIDIHKILPIFIACVISVIAIYIFLKGDIEIDQDRNMVPKPNGGWHTGDKDTIALYGTDICNIDRRKGEELSEEEFETVYRYRKPVIITFKDGARAWTDPEQWSLDSLKREYGLWYVDSGQSMDIVRRGGNGNLHTSFDDFVDKLINSRDTSGEPVYVFDRRFYNDSGLPSTLKPPRYLRIQDGLDDSIFFLGSSGSGVAFHKHADAWNGVIYGRKRWFLYPPDKTPPGGVFPAYSHKDWFMQIYPQLAPGDKPMECIQEAGEILYLPESTYHGTINIGDTIAIGIQRKRAVTQLESIMYEENEMQQRLRYAGPKETEELMKMLEELWEELLRLYPGNSEIQNRAGTFFLDSNNLERALACSKKAYELDKHFLFAVLQMASINFKLGNVQEADRLYQQAESMNPRLWDVYAQYGDFLLKTNRPRDAITILKKGISLKGEMKAFWYHLRMAQLAVGDMVGAAVSRRKIDELSVIIDN